MQLNVIPCDPALFLSPIIPFIYGTRPWKVFGEGPAMEDTAPLSAQGFNEGKGKPFGPQDIRFTTKGDALYAIVLGRPEDGKVTIKSLAENSEHFAKPVAKTELVGTGQKLDAERNSNGLVVSIPSTLGQDSYAFAIKIS